MPTPLIGLDWGSTRLRAYLFRRDGSVQDSRALPLGIRQLPPDGFEGALAQATADWPAVPVIAAGMVGSRNGWREVPYLDVPVDPLKLSLALLPLTIAGGRPLYLVPGVRQPRGPDLMRGEETQLVGAIDAMNAPAERATFVLPGTHSKWVSVRHNRIVDFATSMTGELYAVLTRDTMLAGGGIAEADPAAFARGLRAVRDSGDSGAFALLFSARALVLDGKLAPTAVPDYLSGLLIGEEFRTALAGRRFDRTLPLQLVGEPALCERYREAAARFELAATIPTTDAAARGLWLIATMAGLVGTASQSASGVSR